MQIEIKQAGRTYTTAKGTFTALDKVNLSIAQGELICLLGPSGCGKSTLLNAVAGFDLADTGSIKINEQEVSKPDIRYVTIFQNYGLLPWRTVRKNVELGLETLKLPVQERKERALKYLKLVGLEKFANSYPKELSGGMQQRVSIARALAVEPEVLLMDEPTSALDPISTSKIEDLAVELKSKYTIIMVTHNMQQAVRISDNTAFFLLGEMVEYGKSDQLFSMPQDKRTEDYITGRFG